MGKLVLRFLSFGSILIVSALCSAVIIFVTLFYSMRGIDLIDEGYYLTVISNPLKYNNTLSQFGIAYHNIYKLSGQSISTIRIINIAITFALASALSWAILSNILHNQSEERLSRLVIAAALGTTSLAMLRLWLPTPSYNWLAFQALMITAIGLLLSRRELRFTSVFGWALIALGGWLAFIAKPTSAAAAAILSFVYLATTRRLSIGLVTVTALILCSLLAATAYVLDGSFSGFVGRYSVGLERAGAYGMGHTLSAVLRLDTLPLDWSALKVMAIACLAATISASFITSANRALRAASYLSCAACASLTVSLALDLLGGPYDYGLWQQLFLAAIGLSASLFAFVYSRRGHQIPNSTRYRETAILLAALPFAFVAGTANNYWFMAGLVGFFWVLAGALVIGARFRLGGALALMIPFIFAAQFIAAGQILFGITNPYYQPGPLRSADYRIDLGDRGGVLRVAPSTGAFIEAIRKTAYEAGFQQGTPVIDLTGHSPGVLYVMGASSTGQPWLIGNFPGMPGSNRVATEVLTGASCSELARAWLLIEPKGPYSFPSTIISVFGADQSRDFSVAGSFSSADPLSNFRETRSQHLMRPNRSFEEALRACTEAKAALTQQDRSDNSDSGNQSTLRK